MPIESLSPAQLRAVCPEERFAFTSTAELEPTTNIIGQPRGVRAIEFGMGIQSHGYNIYVLGELGTGRTTAIKRFLYQHARQESVPADWAYVHNFKQPYEPAALKLLPGTGRQLQVDMHRLINELRQDLPRLFEGEPYQKTLEAIQKEAEPRQVAILQAVRLKVADQGLALVESPGGFALVPIKDGQPLSPTELHRLPAGEKSGLAEKRLPLSQELADALGQIERLAFETRGRLKEMSHEATAVTITPHFTRLVEKYDEQLAVMAYLEAVQLDFLAQIDNLPPPVEVAKIDLKRYEINLLIDNSECEGAPVVIETNPEYEAIFGRLEYELSSGGMAIQLTNIECGSLHEANGGYLIIDAQDLMQQPHTWAALRRVLKSSQLHLQTITQGNGRILSPKSLNPQPIPLSVKLILLGSPALYDKLYEQDDDFRALFKVRAEFDDEMPRDAAREQAYAQFIATRCHEEALHHFAPSAVAKVVEFGSRLAGDQRKLSTHFGQVADLVREASYWADRYGRSLVTAVDVQKALFENRYRANILEQKLQEEVLEGSLFITTDGQAVGQVNGLSIYDTGEYSFGQPSCITARTFMGEGGIIDIERETDMSGPSHEKGVLTLSGYLGGMYAQDQPLSLTASLTFEQTYGKVDGDSATAAELYALLSCLTRIAVKQGVAVTGSINQHGLVQPIGGVNEKIEGFFSICQARGLTGEQGVIIPASNSPDLMLAEGVVAAVAAGQFHIWPVHNVNEGIELLTGQQAVERDQSGKFPEGTFHFLAQKRLREMALALKSFGDDGHEDEDKT